MTGPPECLIPLRVTPRASAERISFKEGVLNISICAAPVDGEANEAVIKTLAKSIGIAKKYITIVRGEKSRNKLVRIQGLTQTEIQAKIIGI